MPARYRQVSVAAVPSLAADDLEARFAGREAFFRTRFVVARLDGDPQRCALVELARDDSSDLFSPALAARVLAPADECAYVRDDTLDPEIATNLAAVAERAGNPRCVVLEGRYHHISFLLNPEPVRVTLVDVVPPEPSKLADQVARVLDTAENLPPVAISECIVDSRSLLSQAAEPPSEGLMVPCRGGGVEVDGVAVSHLDERPAFSGSTLLGCERSQQIHRWFYGADAPQTIDWCPRLLLADAALAEAVDNAAGPVLSRCCMLDAGLDRTGATVMVPWGATLAEVRAALESLTQDAAWTRT